MDSRGPRKPSDINRHEAAHQRRASSEAPRHAAAHQRPVYREDAYRQPVNQADYYPEDAYRQPVYREPVYQDPAYQPRTYQREAYQVPARRRRRVWPWVLALLAVVVIAIPVVGIGMNNASQPQPAADNPTANETSGQEAGAPGSEVNDTPAAASDTSSSESSASQEEGSSSSSSSSAGSGDLSWRDKEFAADPDKKTDWNYEPTSEKVVYLTIDDGPSARTQEVLDILDKYGCKATFFVTGIDQEYAPMIAESYKRGHTIGLHTYSHDYAEVYASQEAYFDDLNRIGALVEEQIGYVPCFIRFPGGSSNEISNDYTPGIMPVLTGEVQAAGYQYYDWSGSVGDGSEHTTDEILGYGCEYDDQDNIVLLLHDSGGKQTTVEALPGIIEHYQDLGYTFKALDRESYVPQHL